MVKVELHNPTQYNLDNTKVERLLQEIAECEGWSAPLVVSIVLVDNDRIKELNLSYLGRDYPTDVIAFHLPPVGDEPHLADIYISWEEATTHAADHKTAVKEEIMRLIIHGFLHVLGYDDTTPANRARMLDRGERYLRMWRACT